MVEPADRVKESTFPTLSLCPKTQPSRPRRRFASGAVFYDAVLATVWAGPNCDLLRSAYHRVAADPLAVSVLCQFVPKIAVAPRQRHRCTNVALCTSPDFGPKNAVPGFMKRVFGSDLLLDTQEVTGSSPVSPIARKSLQTQHLRGFAGDPRALANGEKRSKVSKKWQFRWPGADRSEFECQGIGGWTAGRGCQG